MGIAEKRRKENGAYRIPRLKENSAGASKLAHETFTRSEASDDAAASDTLHDVLEVPGDEVAVVDDVLLAVGEVLADDGAEARDPEQADAGDLVNPEALSRKHGLAEALALVVALDALGVGDVGVFADAPGLLAREPDGGDVAEHARRQQELPGPDEVGLPQVRARRH